MNANKDFIEEYGKNIFDEIFESIYDFKNKSTSIFTNVEVISKQSLDREGNNHEVYVLIFGTVFVEYRDGNFNGSEIINYGTDIYPGFIPLNKIRDIKINQIFENEI